jgi:hypothetical protein
MKITKTISTTLALAGLLVAADTLQPLTGVITDTMCGAKHTMMKGTPDDQCVKMCTKGPNDYALYDGTTVWKLSDQKKAAQFPAKQVTVTGTVGSPKTIRVASIEAVN